MGNLCNRCRIKRKSPIHYKHSYDYDLIVIGGGSGGIAAAKEAAKLEQKVCLCDYVVPSPYGTQWGLGGTCLNVGCVPKKLLHTVAIVSETLQIAPSLGFNSVESILKKGPDPTAITKRPEHDWNLMIEKVQTYIRSMNWKNRIAVKQDKIDYKNAFAVFVDSHTLDLTKTDEDGNKEITTITGFHILIAIGGRPNYLTIPGGRKEDGICITSDDLFSLPFPPGKTLIVGASYIALECAGFLVSLGFDVTIMVRSIFLRGFDQGMANKVAAHLEELGVRILKGFEPEEIKQLDNALPPKIRVKAKNSKKGKTHDDTYNTVLLAIGRKPNTFALHPENAEIELHPKSGKIIVDKYEKTNKKHIFSVGDCAESRPELASTAIAAGKLLSERLYLGSRKVVEYDNVPTTIFTPFEYGCIGLSEEDAIEKYGESNLAIYHNNIQPMEFVIPQKYPKTCYIKLICLKKKNERVIGLHYFGPNAGEVTQAFALGFKFKAKKSDFDRTIGIHPTSAEKFTIMNILKGIGNQEEDENC